MAAKSMTGFGRAAVRSHGVCVTVELSSVNRKQLDIALRLPPQLAELESRVQKVIQAAVSRGRISGTIQLESAVGDAMMQVDRKRAEDTVDQLRRVAKKLGLKDDLNASVLLQIPGLLNTPPQKQDPEKIFEALEKALLAALKKLNAMRACEGRALGTDLLARLKKLEAMRRKIEIRAPRVVSAYRNKLVQGLEKSEFKIHAEDERIRKEIALFAERSDISEETTRLASHIQQFKKIMRENDPAGRALDFLAQELFREINTIGSKANDLMITEQVVAFKTELERIREQIQNVE
ncbi:MAG: hypothetical protein PWQ29_1096 [Verrucomicrobiota bacterium]|jgi:uncharacterized protein (TIGR00255 family)|nr:hypothetical protein [Verrucomicrobiota bacterium]MDK2963702.1 hypothetical protein [Verrucomicrobiota bacterium]